VTKVYKSRKYQCCAD